MIVGDFPYPSDTNVGTCFTGAIGALVREMLTEAGMNWDEIYRTTVVKQYMPITDIRLLKMQGISIESEQANLWKEIETIRPNCILALGTLALETLTTFKTMQNYRGSILQTSDQISKVVATYNPRALIMREEDKGLINYSAKAYMQLDFNRAVEESKTKEYVLPYRLLQVARNSYDLYQFFQTYRGKPLATVDIETHNCVPTCVAIAFTKGHAISIPLRYILSPEFPKGISMRETVEIWRLLSEFFTSGVGIIGQNFKFDQSKLYLPCGFRISNTHADTSLIAHTLNPEFPVNQAFLASLYTREPYYKEEGKGFNPKKDSWDRHFLYNAKDAAVDMEIYEEQIKELQESNLYDFYFTHVHPRHDLYVALENEGLLIDPEQQKFLKAKYKFRQSEVTTELTELIGHELNVNSPKQVAALLYGELRCPIRKDTGEDSLVGLMNNVIKDDKRKRIISLILEGRRVRKTIGTYLEAKADFDGRMRSAYRICGTETGRSSTAIMKSPIRPIKIGIAFQTMTKHGDTGADLRSMYIPDPGHVFVEIDLSQAEARIVALLSEDEKLLKMFADGMDVHKITAATIFGCSVESIDTKMRFIGKESRHAGNYDVKKKRFMLMVNSDAKKFGIDINISEWRANQILESYANMHPLLDTNFRANIRRVLDTTRTIVNPFGRRRQFFDRLDDNMYREGYAQIPQSTVRDQVCQAMCAIKKRIPEIRFCGEAHDSFLVQAPEDKIDQWIPILKEEMEKPIDFKNCTLSRGILIIPSDAQVGLNYKELRKYDGN